MICLGRSGRETEDLDIDSLGDDQVRAAFAQVAVARDIKLDDYDICALPGMPNVLAGTPTHYARFGLLDVYFANPNTMVVGKLDRLAKTMIVMCAGCTHRAHRLRGSSSASEGIEESG